MTQEAQPATPEQLEQAQRVQAAIQQAAQQAYKDVQRDAHLEINIRNSALDQAVKFYKGIDNPEEVTKIAATFLKFLKTGDTVQTQGAANE